LDIVGIAVWGIVIMFSWGCCGPQKILHRADGGKAEKNLRKIEASAAEKLNAKRKAREILRPA
jgi:hypothetical protein